MYIIDHHITVKGAGLVADDMNAEELEAFIYLYSNPEKGQGSVHPLTSLSQQPTFILLRFVDGSLTPASSE